MKQMKFFILLVTGILSFQAICSAQCSVNFQKILDEYCSGNYLIHYELDNEDASHANLVLEGGYYYSLFVCKAKLHSVIVHAIQIVYFYFILYYLIRKAKLLSVIVHAVQIIFIIVLTDVRIYYYLYRTLVSPK